MEPSEHTCPEIEKEAKALIAIAQACYDEWDASGEEGDAEVGFGGICHLIAEGISGHLNEQGIESHTVSSNFEQHVYVVSKTDAGVFSVDIPPSCYETGAGYTWTKKPGITFTRGMLDIYKLDNDPGKFPQYTED